MTNIYKYDNDGNFIEECWYDDILSIHGLFKLKKLIETKKVDEYNNIWSFMKSSCVFNNKNVKREVIKTDLSGNIVKIFESATQAANEDGNSVWKVLNGTNKTHKKHTYNYKIINDIV